MDKKALVEPDIEKGERLVDVLERAGLPIAAAMWLKRPDDEFSSLYVATPDVEKHGPIAVYRFIDRVLAALGDSAVSIDDVVAANTTNHFVNAVSSAIGSRPGPMRVVNSTLSGVPVEDAVVYRANRKVRPSQSAPRVTAETRKRIAAAA
jgi:hypothetical protein